MPPSNDDTTTPKRTRRRPSSRSRTKASSADSSASSSESTASTEKATAPKRRPSRSRSRSRAKETAPKDTAPKQTEKKEVTAEDFIPSLTTGVRTLSSLSSGSKTETSTEESTAPKRRRSRSRSRSRKEDTPESTPESAAPQEATPSSDADSSTEERTAPKRRRSRSRSRSRKEDTPESTPESADAQEAASSSDADSSTEERTAPKRRRSRSRSRSRKEDAPDATAASETTEVESTESKRSTREEPKTKSGRTLRTRRGKPVREDEDSSIVKTTTRKKSAAKSTRSEEEPKTTRTRSKRTRSDDKPRTEPIETRSSSKTKTERKSSRKTTGRKTSSRKSASSKSNEPRTIIFSEEAGYEVAAIKEGKRLINFWVQEERRTDTGQAGNVYRGIVGKVLPALNAAFVDIGVGKDGFLSFDELGPEIYRQRKSGKKSRFDRIDQVLKEGDAVMVQVAKEAISDKGAALTTKMSFPGRFVVYMPFNSVVRMSRQLSATEKKKFSKMAEQQDWLDGGVIVRTAAHQQTEAEIEHDFHYLKELWEKTQDEFGSGKTPKRLHQELNLFERVLRDHLHDEVENVALYHPRLKYRVKQFLREVAPRRDAEELLTLHTDTLRSVWSEYRLEREIDQLFGNTVSLDCGGYLIIEELETLTAIDINSGSNLDRKNLEATIHETNVEGAVEVARQLRLRQIGGIIIVDFIDMTNIKHQEDVFRTLEAELEKDRVASNIQQFTELGLIQITRQRTGKSLTKRLTFACPHCSGSGRLPSIALTKRIQES